MAMIESKFPTTGSATPAVWTSIFLRFWGGGMRVLWELCEFEMSQKMNIFFLFCFSKEEDHCLFLTSSLRNVFAKNRADKCPRQNGRPSFFHPLGKKEFFLCDFLFRTISFSILLLCTTLHPILSSPYYSFVCHLHPTSPQGRFLPSFLFLRA